MLASLMAAFRIPDLKKRITFLFAMFAVYVIGLHISVPGVNAEALRKLFGGSNNLFDLFDAFTGGAFKKYTIFAMGIMPYINASIIMQLLTIAIPQLEALQKEGASGQKKIRLYTRWLTGVLALFQAYGTTMLLRSARRDTEFRFIYRPERSADRYRAGGRHVVPDVSWRADQ